MASTKGHPRGLYRLFFTEMWERLAFYTMLNVLLLYATDTQRGGLGLSAAEGNEIYGLYLAFVYFTPFPGGLIADRFIGYRRAVLIGGFTMAAGLFSMSIPGTNFFIGGLALLVLGNGLLKPNISVMVGNLYEPGDPKRDAGFNIFYMGINIGAFIAGFLSGWVRNGYGWLWTFRVAGLGLVIGMIILIFSWKILEEADRRPEQGEDDIGFGQIALKILLPAFAVGLVGYVLANMFLPEGFAVRPAVCGFLAGMVPVIIFFVRLGLKAKASERAGLLALLPIYVAGGTFFMILHLNGSAMTQWARDATDRDIAGPLIPRQDALPGYYGNAKEDAPRPHPDNLVVVDSPQAATMFGLKKMDQPSVELVLEAGGDLEVREFEINSDPTTLSTEDALLWQFSTLVYKEGALDITEGVDSHGAPTVGVEVKDGEKPERRVAFLREEAGSPFGTYVLDHHAAESLYQGYESQFGHPPEQLARGSWLKVVNPEIFQSLNALFVVAFTPLVVAFFGWLTTRGAGVTTARKIFIGLVLTTVSLLVMALAGLMSDGNAVKVSGLWLAGFYAIVTLGELLLSPMGLSLVTKLAPQRLVGLAMGGWFIATAFGNNFSGFFGGIQHMMSPVSFFLVLAGLSSIVAGFIFALLPFLDRAIKECGG